jgi:GNAT superfamily N-acetyltransferase
MSILDGYTELEPGKIASVVTYLEMQGPPDAAAVPAKPEWCLERCSQPDVQWYRSLFLVVGKEWLWFSRLQMTDDALRSVIHDRAVDIFCFKISGEDKGILELDGREMPDIEIAFIGLTPETIGHGAGKFLLDQAIRLAWSRRPRRVLVHTCTLDHPRALPLYCAAGFVPYKRAIEVAADPRLDGTLPLTAAAHVPLIRA